SIIPHSLSLTKITTQNVNPVNCRSTIRSYQVRATVKKRCEHCYMVKRKGRLYVLCKKNNRHKQRQG
ncbi:ribosomal protein L36-domain-containing protein, partial [Paraphysoderma sedebokerense]